MSCGNLDPAPFGSFNRDRTQTGFRFHCMHLLNHKIQHKGLRASNRGLKSNFVHWTKLRGAQWSVAELDRILYENVVEVGGGHLRTFTTLEFEHENYQGRYTARCFAFEKHYGQTVQVVYYCCLFVS